MASLMALGPCWACRNPFWFNPEWVPSVRDDNGVKQPICANCMAQVNEIRRNEGMQPVTIHPLAYKEQEVD